MGDYVVITHTDLDGVTSSSLVLKHLRNNYGVTKVDVRFTQPHRLHKLLKTVKSTNVFICDLGVNTNTYNVVVDEVRRLISNGATIYWFDHHIWDDGWVASLRELGVKLYIDNSTCSAGVVVRYLNLNDDVSLALARAACSVDLWLFNDPLGNFLSRYVVCRNDGTWRRYLINKLLDFNGYIDDEIKRCAEKVVVRELKIMEKVLKEVIITDVKGIKLAFTMKLWDDGSTSYIAHYLMSKVNTDVVIVCKESSLSIRSRDLNIRDLAVKLGGGGHPHAAGAPFKLPFIYKLMLYIGIRKPVLKLCSNIISKELEKVLSSR